MERINLVFQRCFPGVLSLYPVVLRALHNPATSCLHVGWQLDQMIVVGPFQPKRFDSILFSCSSRTCGRLWLGSAALLLVGIVPRTSFLTLQNEYVFWQLFEHLLFQEAGDDANCFSPGSVGLSGVSWGRSLSRSCVVPLEEQHPDSSGLKKKGRRFLSSWPTTGLTPAGNESAKPHHQTLHCFKKSPVPTKPCQTIGHCDVFSFFLPCLCIQLLPLAIVEPRRVGTCPPFVCATPGSGRGVLLFVSGFQE